MRIFEIKVESKVTTMENLETGWWRESPKEGKFFDIAGSDIYIKFF